MGLLGRDRELEAIRRAVADLRAGAGRVLVIFGEPGIGKSALLKVLAERASGAGALVIEGRAAEHERAVPYGLVAATLGVEPVVGADPVERFRTNRTLRAHVASLSSERPVALVFDDLHWADEASLDFMAHLLRHPPAAPYLFALATRGPAPRLLEAARSAPGFEPLELGPLDHEASLALLAGVGKPAQREQVARDAGGNPFFLGELARVASRDALPGTVLAAVALELAALPGMARRLLEGAAVAGDPFDPELAVAAAGLAPDSAALDQLVDAGLLRATADCCRLTFRHALVARAVYDLTPPAWRFGAHERAAAELGRRGAACATRAHHVARFARPGNREAVALLVQAATESTPAIASHWYERALELTPVTERGNLLVRLASALSGAGRLEDSLAALRAAIVLAGPEQQLDLSIACARAETGLCRHGDARARLLAARASASSHSGARLAFELAAAAFHQGRVGELREWAEPALEAAVKAGDPVLEAGAAALAGLAALWAGEPDRASAGLARAGAGLAALDDGAVSIGTYVGVAQYLAEQFTDAAATSERALAGARRTGQQQIVTLLGLRAKALLHLLDLDGALRAAEAAEEVARLQHVPHGLHFALWVRAVIHDQRGERAAVERCVAEGSNLTSILESTKLTRTAACTFAAFGSDPLREMRLAAGPALEDADPSWRTWLLLRLVRATLGAGATGEAEELAAVAQAHAARLRLPVSAVRAACARAETLLARDRATDALTLAREAATAADRVGAPLDALAARLLAGRAGDRSAREHALAQARSAGHAAAAPRGPLTERERDVADLVARGQSNRQVAASLFLSEKTVANTLTRVYAKLGVRSRAQLAHRSI